MNKKALWIVVLPLLAACESDFDRCLAVEKPKSTERIATELQALKPDYPAIEFLEALESERDRIAEYCESYVSFATTSPEYLAWEACLDSDEDTSTVCDELNDAFTTSLKGHLDAENLGGFDAALGSLEVEEIAHLLKMSRPGLSNQYRAMSERVDTRLDAILAESDTAEQYTAAICELEIETLMSVWSQELAPVLVTKDATADATEVCNSRGLY